MDLSSGGVRQLADYYYLQVVGGGAAWIGSLNPADPNPQAGLGTNPDSIDRYDLVTGVRTTWLYMPGMAVYVIGLDQAGHPIVQAGSNSTPNEIELLLLTGPGLAHVIYKGAFNYLWSFMGGQFGNPIADSHGVWFGSANGIFLYSPTDGLRKVSDLGFYPGNGCI